MGRIYFGNAENVGRKLRALISANSPRVILLDCSATPGFEYTALRMLVEAEARLRKEGTRMWLASLNPEALELVQHTGSQSASGAKGCSSPSSRPSQRSRVRLALVLLVQTCRCRCKTDIASFRRVLPQANRGSPVNRFNSRACAQSRARSRPSGATQPFLLRHKR